MWTDPKTGKQMILQGGQWVEFNPATDPIAQRITAAGGPLQAVRAANAPFIPGQGITPQIQSMLNTYQQGRPVPGIAPVTVGAAPVAQPGQMVAPTVGPQQVANSFNATAPTIGPAALAAAAQAHAAAMQAARIDQGQSNQTRFQQEQSILGLQNAAAGKVPSAAELQEIQTRDANVANQYAIAAALQGRSPGGALQQASSSIGAINAKAAADAGILRAQEQATARQQLAQTLEGVRTGDINVATSQAGLENTANLTNANNFTGVSQSNALLGTNVSVANAAQQNVLAQKQADLQSQAALQNANLATQTSQYNAGQGNTLTALQANLLSTAGVTNANNATSIANTNANNATTLQAKQAEIAQQTAVDNVANVLKARGLDDAQVQAFLQQLVTSKGQDITGTNQAQANANALALGQGDLALRNAILNWTKTVDVVGGIAGAAGSLLTAAGTAGGNDYIKSLFANGQAPGYTPTPYTGVDNGPGANASDTAGNIGPVSSDNPLGTG